MLRPIFLAAIWGATIAAQSPGPPAIKIADRGVFPESLTASRDGTIFAGNIGKAVIYRAAPRATVATPWITFRPEEASRVMGLLADDRRKTLWACTYAPGPDGPKGPASIRAFDLATGKERQRHAFDGGCNDMTVAADGTVYATDFTNGRVLRLRPGATAFTVIAAAPELASADGIALLDDGALLVNTFRGGKLFRISTDSGDHPATIRPITTSQPLERPDGMRAIGANRFALAEGGGRIDELRVSGDHAEVRTIAQGLPKNPTSVAVVGKRAIVSTADFSLLGQAGADAIEAKLQQIPFP